MQVNLSHELEHFVNERVSAGLYQSPTEVIQQGLRLLSEYDQLMLIKRNALQKDLERGIRELDHGLGAPLDMNALIKQAEHEHHQAK